VKRYKVLVVEDEVKILRFLLANLKSLGYEVFSAAHGIEALEKVDAVNPDLILLDVRLPGLDGFAVLQKLRAYSDVPVIILSAHANVPDKVNGFNKGADDYIVKPFSLDELFARVRAVLRRFEKSDRKSVSFPSEVVNGPMRINFARRCIWIGAREVRFTEKEYDVFALLLRRRGNVVSHDEMLSEVWDCEYRGEVKYLRVTIARIRQKIKSAGCSEECISTYPGVGYMVPCLGEQTVNK